MINVSLSKRITIFKQVNKQPFSTNPFSYYFPGCSKALFRKEIFICPIYLLPINSIKARPKSCEHLYCHKCLILWNKQKNTCPLCRKKFSKIILPNKSISSFLGFNPKLIKF